MECSWRILHAFAFVRVHASAYRKLNVRMHLDTKDFCILTHLLFKDFQDVLYMRTHSWTCARTHAHTYTHIHTRTHTHKTSLRKQHEHNQKRKLHLKICCWKFMWFIYTNIVIVYTTDMRHRCVLSITIWLIAKLRKGSSSSEGDKGQDR